MNENPEFKSRLELAIDVARKAGEHTLKYFCQPDLKVDLKGDASPVTRADQEAELLLRELISAQFPSDGILGEEFPELPGTSGYRWIVDPIDGTKSFISGVPLYGNMIGIEFEGKSVVGVINIPALHEGIYASVGGGAWHYRGDAPATRAQVSNRVDLTDSLYCTGEVLNYKKRGGAVVYESIQAKARLTRTWGDCYGYMLVATGRAEVMIDPVMSVWDAAAVQPILEEAGGTFTDWQGNPTIHNCEGIATNGKVFEQVMAITRSVTKQA